MTTQTNDHEDFGNITFCFEDERKEAKKAKGFDLNDAMLNKRQFDKVKADYAKIKEVIVDISINLKDLEQNVKRNMVTQNTLKVQTELFEQSQQEEIRRGLQYV